MNACSLKPRGLALLFAAAVLVAAAPTADASAHSGHRQHHGYQHRHGHRHDANTHRRHGSRQASPAVNGGGKHLLGTTD